MSSTTYRKISRRDKCFYLLFRYINLRKKRKNETKQQQQQKQKQNKTKQKNKKQKQTNKQTLNEHIITELYFK